MGFVLSLIEIGCVIGTVLAALLHGMMLVLYLLTPGEMSYRQLLATASAILTLCIVGGIGQMLFGEEIWDWDY